MIRCNEQNVSEFLASFVYRADCLITMTHCLDGSVVNTSMSNHIGICKIQNNEGVFSCLKNLDSFICYTMNTHFPEVSHIVLGLYGSRSYVATFGLGIISRSSRGYCFSTPPLKNYN